MREASQQEQKVLEQRQETEKRFRELHEMDAEIQAAKREQEAREKRAK